jgi:hypothetical protein
LISPQFSQTDSRTCSIGAVRVIDRSVRLFDITGGSAGAVIANLLQAFNQFNDRNEKLGNEKHGNEKHGNEKHGNEKHGNEKHCRLESTGTAWLSDPESRETKRALTGQPCYKPRSWA